MTLKSQIAETEARLAELRRQEAAATCAEHGCDLRFEGGKNIGCDDDCVCTTSVHVCTRCGASDFGDPVEAADVRARCEETGHGNLA
mgnify:CR=1 FL=1